MAIFQHLVFSGTDIIVLSSALGIIESVDSNVGIARTRNIWQYIKISPNLKNGMLISHNNVPFIVKCFHDQQVSQWCKKASRRYQTRSSQNGRNVFLSFFLLSSSDVPTPRAGLRMKQQHFILSSARPHRFFTTSKSREVLVATHLNTTASNLGCHFLYLYLRMHT